MMKKAMTFTVAFYLLVFFAVFGVIAIIAIGSKAPLESMISFILGGMK